MCRQLVRSQKNNGERELLRIAVKVLFLLKTSQKESFTVFIEVEMSCLLEREGEWFVDHVANTEEVFRIKNNFLG